MSSRLHAELESITDEVEAEFKLITRAAYLEALRYLISLSSDFEIDGPRIEQLDSAQAWPAGFDVTRYNEPSYIDGLFKYRTVPLSVHLNSNRLLLKFPVVQLIGVKVSSYQTRQWKRYTSMGNSIYYGTFETKAFGVGRIPTKEELLTAHHYVYSSSSHVNSIATIHFDTESDIPAEIEDKFKKYSAALKKREHYGESSRDLAYKTYVKYRANVAFERWKETNRPKVVVKQERMLNERNPGA